MTPDAARFGRPQVEGRPRVAFVAHEISEHGGMDSAVTELIRRLHATVDFVVVSGGLPDELRTLVEWRRVRFPRRPFPLRYIAFQALAGLIVRRLRVDLVHTLGAIVPNRVDIASVHACHAGFVRATTRLAPADAPFGRKLNTGISRLLSLAAERWTYRPKRARVLAAVSSGLAGELRSAYPGVSVATTPNGVDTSRFRRDQDARRRLRSELGVADTERAVLFVGGNWDHKGLAILFDAVARLDGSAGCAPHIWVVGRGDRARYERLARGARVADRVTFFGPRVDTERFYQAADVFVLPSAYEAFSLVLLEAAACGLPFVVTRVNGVSEIVGDDDAQVVERTPEAVAEALSVFLVDDEVRARVGAGNAQRAHRFTWEASAESVLELYDSLLKPKQSHAHAGEAATV